MKLVSSLLMIAALEATAFAAPTTSTAPTPEDLYAEGQTAYEHADYATAIAKWNASYDLSGANDLLFNIAQATRLSGDCERALAAYKRFVAIAPTSDQHQLALDFARELEPKCGARSAPVAEPPKLDRDLNLAKGLSHPEHGRTLKVASFVTGGAGTASIAVGLILGHHASTLSGEVTSACAVSCDWAAQKSKDAAGHRDAGLGYAFDALGAAAIAGSVIMYYLGDRGGVTIVPQSREGAVVSWSGSW